MTTRDDDFETLYARYYAPLVRFLRGMLAARADAAPDLAHDAFVRLHAASVAEPDARFWLFRVARNLALNELKRRTLRDRLAALIPFASPRTPHELAVDDERRRRLMQHVARLPEDQRAALLLREWEELSYEEIAAALETTVAKVRTDLFRARQTLRARWKE
jgi:RNA polymerase sigma-70 factor (ECF subfamily)